VSMTNRGRRRIPIGARTARRRIISVAACGALVATMTTGCWAEPSAMPAVRDFLIAWQVGNYPAAAKKTVGADRKAVSGALGAVRAQLDAASLRLALGVPGQGTEVKAIDKKGDEADARFSVKVDLGENGQPWTYTGLMHLKRVGGKWKVVWDPSIINPKLRPGQRLAVITEVPKRAPIKDALGRSLLQEVRAINVGVFPGRLASQQRTLEALTKQTKIDGGRRLDSERLLGRVRSAPPQKFLPLLTLQVPAHNALLLRLRQIDGLKFQEVRLPIAPKLAPELVGGLGPATADRLQQVGAPYQPGDTIGVSGIQLLQQRRLAGTPTVRVVAQDSAGANVQELVSWEGQTPQEVGTTIDPSYQMKAEAALAGLTVPASLVAVRPSTGEVLAVSNHGTNGVNTAFEGRYPPGMTFGIVVAEALFSHAGMNQSSKVTCPGTVTVGGSTFTNQDRGSGTLSAAVGNACETTFAQLGSKLDAQTLVAETSRLGLGKSWGLSVPAFTGSVPTPSGEGEKATTMVGKGKVQVSPLAMALVAAAAQNGTWKPPYVLKDLTNPAEVPQAQNLQPESIASLKRLMARTIKSPMAEPAAVTGGVVGIATPVSYTEGGRSKTVSWFVGSHNDLAFAVAVEGLVPVAKVVQKFLRPGSPAPRTNAR